MPVTSANRRIYQISTHTPESLQNNQIGFCTSSSVGSYPITWRWFGKGSYGNDLQFLTQEFEHSVLDSLEFARKDPTTKIPTQAGIKIGGNNLGSSDGTDVNYKKKIFIGNDAFVGCRDLPSGYVITLGSYSCSASDLKDSIIVGHGSGNKYSIDGSVFVGNFTGNASNDAAAITCSSYQDVFIGNDIFNNVYGKNANFINGYSRYNVIVGNNSFNSGRLDDSPSGSYSNVFVGNSNANASYIGYGSVLLGSSLGNGFGNGNPPNVAVSADQKLESTILIGTNINKSDFDSYSTSPLRLTCMDTEAARPQWYRFIVGSPWNYHINSVSPSGAGLGKTRINHPTEINGNIGCRTKYISWNPVSSSATSNDFYQVKTLVLNLTQTINPTTGFVITAKFGIGTEFEIILVGNTTISATNRLTIKFEKSDRERLGYSSGYTNDMNGVEIYDISEDVTGTTGVVVFKVSVVDDSALMKSVVIIDGKRIPSITYTTGNIATFT